MMDAMTVALMIFFFASPVESKTVFFQYPLDQNHPNLGEARQYHALTRGWIANEIFRRVHPDGVTIGQFLRKEITEGMGADVYIGLYEEEIERVIPVKMCGWVGPVVRTCLPKHLGSHESPDKLQSSTSQ